MPKYQPDLNQIFHALADPTRRAVVARLCKGSASVTELALPFDMALPSFVQHLKVLEDSGLVRSHKQGRVRTCEIVSNQVEEAEHWLTEQRRFWEKRLDQFDNYVLQLKNKEKNNER